MDIINHAVTLISIIVGIGLTEMFGNLHRLIRNRAQVSWDWLPVLWSGSLLMLVINYWWAIYQGIIGLDQLCGGAGAHSNPADPALPARGQRAAELRRGSDLRHAALL